MNRREELGRIKPPPLGLVDAMMGVEPPPLPSTIIEAKKRVSAYLAAINSELEPSTQSARERYDGSDESSESRP